MGDISNIPLPPIPSWFVLRHWLLGFLWAALGGLGPAAMLVGDSLIRWNGYENPVDWPQVWHIAVGGAAMASGAYYRKYIALLKMPPVATAASQDQSAKGAST